ncbi:ATP-grasp domain-containing protein, partial [Microvirga sp. 3-52]|nr:ATP-grasp domain-containing protein [Microvirga sp. 3-52]
FKTPETFLSVNDALEALRKNVVSFPLIIKPRWGMGSISIFEVENRNELEVLFNKTKRNILSTYLSFESQQNIENCVVIQEKLKGQEYGLDVINDLNGNYKVTCIKKKIAMRSGETDRAETITDSRLSRMGEKLSNQLKHIGNLDVDAFIVNEIPYVLEMNARFGGGYP